MRPSIPNNKEIHMSKLKTTAILLIIAAVLSAIGSAIFKHYQEA